jgi:hypothetical protein
MTTPKLSIKKIDLNPKLVLLILTTLTLSTLALSVFGIKLGAANLKKKSNAVLATQTEIELLTEKVDRNIQLEKKLESLADVELAVNKLLPTEKRQTPLLTEIFTIANINKIPYTEISFNASGSAVSDISQTEELKGAKNIRIYPYSTKSSCQNFDQILSFLRNLAGENGCSVADATSIDELKIEVYLKNETTSTKAPTPAK